MHLTHTDYIGQTLMNIHILKIHRCMTGHIFIIYFDKFEHIDAQIEQTNQSQL